LACQCEGRSGRIAGMSHASPADHDCGAAVRYTRGQIPDGGPHRKSKGNAAWHDPRRAGLPLPSVGTGTSRRESDIHARRFQGLPSARRMFDGNDSSLQELSTRSVLIRTLRPVATDGFYGNERRQWRTPRLRKPVHAGLVMRHKAQKVDAAPCTHRIAP